MFRVLVMLILGAAVLLAVPLAAVGRTMHSELTGDLGSLDLWAEVTFQRGVGSYFYSYELTAVGTNSAVHHIDLGNPNALYFWDAFNDGIFADPVYQPYLTSMIWGEGDLAPGEAVRFGFYSDYPPAKVSISAFNRGQRSMGATLGMVPEPTLGFAAVLGLGAIWLRRRR
jgi:MYXO-CTERM domain-containing protein